MGRYTAHVVGEAQFQDVIAEIAGGIRARSVKLMPEPDHPEDPRAIKVITVDGGKVGNLERDSWLVRAMLDDKAPVASRIMEISGGDQQQPLRSIVLEVLTGTEAEEALAVSAKLRSGDGNGRSRSGEKPGVPSALSMTDGPVSTLVGTGALIASVIAVLLLLIALSSVMAGLDKHDPSLAMILPLFLLPGLALFPPVASFVKRKWGVPASTGVHIGMVAISAGVGLAFTVAGTVAVDQAYPELAAKRVAEQKAKRAAKPAATSSKADVAKNLDREEMLALARAALTSGQPERALTIVFDNAPAEMLREDAEVKMLVAEIEARIKSNDASNPNNEFAERVQTYWLPQVNGFAATPPTSAADIWNTIAKLEDAARALEDSNATLLDANGQKAQRDLRNAIAAKQRTLFPILRSAYGKVVGQAMWESDIDIRVGGAGNRNITWTGGLFAARANIARGQGEAQTHLLKLRFVHSTYEWARGIGERNTYTMDAPSDDAVGYWDGGTFKSVG